MYIYLFVYFLFYAIFLWHFFSARGSQKTCCHRFHINSQSEAYATARSQEEKGRRTPNERPCAFCAVLSRREREISQQANIFFNSVAGDVINANKIK